MNSVTLSAINRIINSKIKIIPYSNLLVRSKRRFSSNKQKEEPIMLKRFWKQVSIQSNPGTYINKILINKLRN